MPLASVAVPAVAGDQVAPPPAQADVQQLVFNPGEFRAKNRAKWYKALLCGCASLFSCCCLCCGACGKIKPPAVLYDDEEEYETAYAKMSPDLRQVMNSAQWCAMGAVAYKCVPLCCGGCFGCCGDVSPAEAVECMTNKKK